MPPRQRALPTDFDSRLARIVAADGRQALAGMSRVGSGRGKGRGNQSVLVNVDPGVRDAAGSAVRLTLAATGATVAPGGDYLSFDQVLGSAGFEGVPVPAGDAWVHPISSECWILSYEHAWVGGYNGGGRIRLEVDGVLLPEGVLADGTTGGSGSETIMYGAAAGSVGRILVESHSGGDQTCDAVLRIGVSDPSTDTPVGSIEWTKVFTGDVYDLTWDGLSWWTTDGDVTVTKYDADWVSVASFASDTAGFTRGITFDGTALWVCGDLDGVEVIRRYSTAGALEQSVTTGPQSDGNTGIAFDGSDLWLVVGKGGTTIDLERWSTAGAEEAQYPIGPDSHQGLAYFAGRLYAVNIAADELTVIDTAGTVLSTISLVGVVSSPTGAYVTDDGTLYVSKNGDGVYRRSLQIGGI